MRVKSKSETYGALAHVLGDVVEKTKNARKSIANLRVYYAEDTPTFDAIDARLARSLAIVEPAVATVTDLVPKPSQPAGYDPISEK